MGSSGELGRVEERLTKDLKSTTTSFLHLGKKYGVSRQAIFEFAQRRGIKRPKRPKREHIKNCSVCQSIIRIAQKPHSDFISSRTIKERLRLGSGKWLYHIHILRKKAIVSTKFGRLHSQKVERAYQIYFRKGLPVETIGKRVGFKNLHSVFRRHRTLGWDVPEPLFKHGGKKRRKTVAKMNRKKKRG